MFTLQALFMLSDINANITDAKLAELRTNVILDAKLSDIATLHTDCKTLRECFDSNMTLFTHHEKERFFDNVDSAIELICEQLNINIHHACIDIMSLEELSDSDVYDS